MAARRPLVLVSGRVQEIPAGDTFPPDLGGQAGDAGVFDGGNSATVFTGQPRIDCGAAS